ncbi:MAG TPA: DNA repair protein RecN [Solirubrobacteraceae bacterium]
MLHELRVENLLLLERAELRLAEGLNVLTGETGAGKTLLAQALDLLLGGRAPSRIVRPGAREAYVEGVFELPRGLELDSLPAGAEELVLARRVWADGRTRAYVCGRSATVGDLRELSGQLLHFYGQHEHRKLLLSSAQLDVLDAYCGSEHIALAQRVRTAYERLRDLQSRAAELSAVAGARERELDLITFELKEIEAASPSEQEEAELVAERDRLRHLDALRSAAAAAAEALVPEGGSGVRELVADPVQGLDAAAEVDETLSPLAERLRTLSYEAEDLGAELRGYVLGLDGGVESGPGRLEEVEERLQLFARLERKYGGSIADVLRHAADCAARHEDLQQADVALEGAERELTSAREDLERLAAALSERRRAAAPSLAKAVRGRLSELAMADARFEVRLAPRSDGCGPRGAESVEFEIAVNPGVPGGPLREIASGGELSRVMLALLSVAHGGRGSRRRSDVGHTQPLLVFDEVDAGIGGHTARTVGEHLRALARGRQIFCITHLPQVASLADRHFRIEKDTAAGASRTSVSELSRDGVVSELVRMLGASEGDRAASQHARRLLQAA